VQTVSSTCKRSPPLIGGFYSGQLLGYGTNKLTIEINTKNQTTKPNKTELTLLQLQLTTRARKHIRSIITTNTTPEACKGLKICLALVH